MLNELEKLIIAFQGDVELICVSNTRIRFNKELRATSRERVWTGIVCVCLIVCSVVGLLDMSSLIKSCEGLVRGSVDTKRFNDYY